MFLLPCEHPSEDGMNDSEAEEEAEVEADATAIEKEYDSEREEDDIFVEVGPEEEEKWRGKSCFLLVCGAASVCALLSVVCCWSYAAPPE